MGELARQVQAVTGEQPLQAAQGQGIQLEVVNLPDTLAAPHFLAFAILMLKRFVELLSQSA